MGAQEAKVGLREYALNKELLHQRLKHGDGSALGQIQHRVCSTHYAQNCTLCAVSDGALICTFACLRSLHVREASRKNALAFPGIGASVAQDEYNQPVNLHSYLFNARCVFFISFTLFAFLAVPDSSHFSCSQAPLWLDTQVLPLSRPPYPFGPNLRFKPFPLSEREKTERSLSFLSCFLLSSLASFCK